MTTLANVYAKPAIAQLIAKIAVDSFPDSSLLVGTDARKNCEIIYDSIAVKTGGGSGFVYIDEFGVPTIKGAAGEYTFNWHLLIPTGFDKSATKSAIYTCIISTTPFADTTAPIVTITTGTTTTDLRPALAGTVDDNTARVIATVNNKDYVATVAAGAWNIPINTISPLPGGVNALSVRAIDPSGNIGKATSTIEYTGSAYATLARFDVAEQALLNGWVNGQSITQLNSSGEILSYLEASTIVSKQPIYDSTKQALIFSSTAGTFMQRPYINPFREIFIAFKELSGTGKFEIWSQSKFRIEFSSYDATRWSINTDITPVPANGRIANTEFIVAVRPASGQTIISTNGGTEIPVTTANVSDADFTTLMIPNFNLNGTNIELHEIVLTQKLSAAQRTALITDLKTKWGIV